MNNEERRVEKIVVRANQIHKLKEVLLSLIGDKYPEFGGKDPDAQKAQFENYKENCLRRIKSIEDNRIKEEKFLIDLGEYLVGMKKRCGVEIDIVEKEVMREKAYPSDPSGGSVLV